jgi:hypothetical protein
MERCFSVEAKRFSFSVKSEGSVLRLEDRRKGFCGVIFLGLQGSAWLLATVEEASEASSKDFVKYLREDVKVLMARGGENKSGRFLEVTVFAEGGRKGAIWLPKGRKGGGWARVAGELRKMINFLGPKVRLVHSETFASEGKQLRGASSGRLGETCPFYAAVVRGESVSHFKLHGLPVLDVETRGLDLFPELWCRVAEDGRMAVNCFDLEVNLHGSSVGSSLPTCSPGFGVDPVDKVLNFCPLGKKKSQKTHVVHSARGAKAGHLNSNPGSWVRLLVSFITFIVAMGWVARSGWCLKRKGVRLSWSIPKLKNK